MGTIPVLEIYPNIWLNITICPLLKPENTLLLTTDLSPNILEPIMNTLNTNTLNTNTLNTLKKKNTMKLKICPHTLNPQNSFKNITIPVLEIYLDILNTLNTITLNTNTLNTNTTMKKLNTMKLNKMVKKLKISPHTMNPQNSFKNITIVLKI